MADVSGAIPMPQDQTDNSPVVNIPPSAVPPQLANAPHPAQNQLTRLVTDGKEEWVNHDELVRRAQMGVSAQNKYQEASAKSKEADDAISFRADMELLAETGDINAFRRAGAAMGLSGEEVEEAARIVYEQMGGGQDGVSPGDDRFDENTLYDDYQPAPQRGGNVTVSQRIAQLEAELAKTKAQLSGRQTNFNDLSDDLQILVQDAEQARVDKIIQNALDSDEVVAYYMGSYDEKGKQAILDMVDEKVKGRLDASDGKFGDGTRILREVIPEVRTTLEALGTPNRSTPQMGLGPAPGSQGGADIYPRKQPDHVPSTEPGFEEHIGETLAHNLFKAQQEGR